ncbi:leucyl-tRNA synthetase [Thermomonospora echinospora]|uniref:Leucine--tRNA ligase n=1 Tax=Thermomonospora echinospora TaxID=1992 RepID=A0A1H6CQ12_9ACTN|nr:leucine--tRNA ligase [Thermomonospora echinospora]SEG74546.1 leucyl-tRNA synthetase [Thermomonospora echinospora]
MASTDESAEHASHEYETKWLRVWSERPPVRFDISRADPVTKVYNLVEFPYPSAEGLHVGHVYTYCGADALGRYLSMNGRHVFQPMGFDSFGIHTENYALKIGEHPKSVTDRATANYRRQLGRVGANWAWDVELRTDDPAYYRWTQWIFLKLYEAGLAEKREAPVIWCPSCLTVLAFEQVDGNRCERCGTEVTTKVMKQWFLRITAYADKLLDTLDDLDWPELSKRLQREWMGRSTGADVVFEVQGDPEVRLTAFTTRVDTLFGVTFVAVAPEHDYVKTLIERAANGVEVAEYVAEVAQRVGADRYTNIGGSGRPGIVTDVMAVHPLTGRQVPIVVADYVLAGYGTGVVMGVPAHDERDHRFAETLGLPIVTVVAAPEGEGVTDGAYPGEGALVASEEFTGMGSAEARTAIAAELQARKLGGAVTRYRLQDWLVSRQRYWGSPIPIIYCDRCGTVPVPESDLPVELPEVAEVRPTGTGLSPLAAVPEFVNTECPSCGGEATRETDVFDTFVESSWYFLRYPSRDHTEGPWDPEVTARMLPVDIYAGGREHTTRHHLYARFVTRALYDLGLVPFPEPFKRLRLHGLLIKDGAKMSKSRGNVVNPDEYIDRVGADSLRTYLLFCGPWEEGGDFTDRGLHGIVRFNGRLGALVRTATSGGPGADMRRIDRAVYKVGKDIERLKFNTAIAEIMSLTNWLRDERKRMTADQWDQARRTLVLLIAPFEPFLAEELWEYLGGDYSVHQQRWPAYDPRALVEDEVELPIQINGKARGTVVVPADSAQDDVVAAALKVNSVVDALGGATPRRVVYIPRKIVNLVV